MPHILYGRDDVASVYCVANNSVLLIDHKKLNMWLPPGGHRELGERSDEAACREFKEEVGIECVLVSMAPDHSDSRIKSLPLPFARDEHPINDHHTHVVDVYLARLRSAADYSNVTPNPAEVTAAQWFHRVELAGLPRLWPSVKIYAEYALDLAQKTEPGMSCLGPVDGVTTLASRIRSGKSARPFDYANPLELPTPAQAVALVRNSRVKPDEHGNYYFPDGSSIVRAMQHRGKQNPHWTAHWADKTPLRGCHEPDYSRETTSYFDNVQEPMHALAIAGEGPASEPHQLWKGAT